MAFIKKTWLARLGTGLNKFTVNNSANKISLDSAPDTITQEGTPLSAQNMNDLEDRIETAFTGVDTDLANLAGNFAQIETTPSTHNYSVGDMLVFNGILYKVTTAIATNDALVVGSNIQAQPVASAISDISDIEEIPITINTTYVSTIAPYLRCVRIGKVVYLFIDCNMTGYSSSEWTEVVYLPLSVKPKTDTYCILVNRDITGDTTLVGVWGQSDNNRTAVNVLQKVSSANWRGQIVWVIGE